MKVGFEELPGLFHRLSYFADTATGPNFKPLGFLVPCFKGEKEKCKDHPNEVIKKIEEKFMADPRFLEGECPHKDKDHRAADMSIDEDLNL